MVRWLASSQRHALWMGLLSAVLLTLAAAPFEQWYLAWLALFPWLIAVGHAPTAWSAFGRGWLIGIVYFALNEWWLWTATVPGTVGVVVCSGFYWGLAGAAIRYLRLLPARVNDETPSLDPSSLRSLQLIVRMFAVATVWTTSEWLRCNTVSEFPWLPIGSTQSPVAVMCQIADFAGVWGVSFIVVLVNTLFAIRWLEREHANRLWIPGIVVGCVLLLVTSYGAWRLTTAPNRPGPKILIIQSNHAHLRGGASTTTPAAAAQFFLTEIEKQLSREHADLVILPENEFPPLNEEARAELAQSSQGKALEHIYQQLVAIARQNSAAILVGGAAVTGWRKEGTAHIGSEIRNSAYLFSPTGDIVKRYDKIHLVPFSERLPFAAGPSWLRDITLYLAASRAIQPLQAGTFADFQPFSLTYLAPSSSSTTANFVTPICLENIDPIMSARMVRDPTTGHKRADFFANLSNDGWFHDQEKYQHWQLLAFRCIENRVPLARSSNTGISGFIDSCGRVIKSTPVDEPMAAAERLMLDDRETFYMAHPDVLPIACVAVIAVAVVTRFAATRLSQRAIKTGREEM